MGKICYYGLASQLNGICTKTSNQRFLKHFPNEIRTTVVNCRAVSMSAIQLGEFSQYFVALRPELIKSGKWNNYPKLRPSDYIGFLNPEVKLKSAESNEDWQQCISYPKLRMLIKRPITIKLFYYDEKFTSFREQFTGFMARVIQHEIDHFSGLDFVQMASKLQITEPAVQAQYQQQCTQLFNAFKESIRGKQSPSKIATNIQYNRLKQFLTYSIVDKHRSS